MIEETPLLTQKEARRRLLVALGQNRRSGFIDFATAKLLDPIQQRDANNKLRPHPLFVVGVILLLLMAGGAFFFHYAK